MGDAIDKLPLDDTLDYSQRDITNLKKFFDTTVSKKEDQPKDGKNVYMFVGLVTMLFFICSHPSGPSRMMPEKYRMVGSGILFGIVLFLYLYFNK